MEKNLDYALAVAGILLGIALIGMGVDTIRRTMPDQPDAVAEVPTDE